jgi:hypothetical protein
LRVARELEPVIYAVILIAVMFLLPGGLISLPARLRGKKAHESLLDADERRKDG